MALSNSTPLPFPASEPINTSSLFQPLQQDIVVEFAEQFTKLQGKFSFCMNEEELVANFNKLCSQNGWKNIYCTEPKLQTILQQQEWYQDIKTCDVSVTTCELLVARTGSIILSAAKNGRIPSVYAPIHVCVAYTSQLVYDLTDALSEVKQAYGQNLPSIITLATGPSRTADIEKTLVVGVHGPKEVYCFLIDDQQQSL